MSTKVFSQSQQLSIARRDATASFVNGSQIVVIGGRTGTTVSNVIDVFSGPTIIASTVSSGTPLSTARYGHTASVLPTGHILVIGGFDSTSTPLASVEMVNVGGALVAGGGPTGLTNGTTPPPTQGIPISITPVPSTSVIPSAAANSTGSLIQGVLGNLLGGIFGGGGNTNAGLTPSISNMTPNSGPAGTLVTIQATGIGAYLSVALDNGTGQPVFLANSQCTAYQNGASVQLTFTVPATLMAGTYNVDLITSSYATAGSPAAMAQGTFTKQ
jgi:hypothetical protein